MDTQRVVAKTFGVFFILAFLSYGLGTGLVASISDAPDFLFSLQENKTQYVFGIILMALIHSFVNIGLAVTAFPLLKPHGERLSIGYVSAAITATTVLIIGVQLALPGGLFELALSVWLIVKGFNYSNESLDSRGAVAH